VLLAKDLLRYYASEQEFNVRDMLRPAVFIPESKHLNVLLKDFRNNRNHMAIVIDEYGSIAGLVTIEDVIEQIVGDIEDEFDYDEREDNLLQDRRGNWPKCFITKPATVSNSSSEKSVRKNCPCTVSRAAVRVQMRSPLPYTVNRPFASRRHSLFSSKNNTVQKCSISIRSPLRYTAGRL
jgi:hypothetical protein